MKQKAKPVKEDEGDPTSRHGDKPDVDDELENSGETDDEDEEDGSTTEEPRTRQKRDVYMELEDEEKIKDSSGDDLEDEDEDDSETKEEKSSPKRDRSKSKKKSDSDTEELQMQNAMGIQGPFTITALQPPGSQNPSQKEVKVKQDPFSLDFASPPGNIEITPLEPPVNRMKKVRRRCMCPFPCGPAHSFEVIGCSGPYTVPCGGFGGGWPGLGCGGFGGMVPPYGLGGYGGCGYPPVMMCCCKKNGKDAEGKEDDLPQQKPDKVQKDKPLFPQASPKVHQPLSKIH
ncbi:hypothetical protein ACROYT_G006686 [Oculina patagonica]